MNTETVFQHFKPSSGVKMRFIGEDGQNKFLTSYTKTDTK